MKVIPDTMTPTMTPAATPTMTPADTGSEGPAAGGVGVEGLAAGGAAAEDHVADTKGGWAPSIDPRIRQRRTAVARDQGRRRLRVIVAVTAAAVLCIGTVGVLHSGLFSARHVMVLGADNTPEAAVVQAAGLTSHPPLIDVNAPAAATAVKALPWVNTAVVARHWPDSVTVTVTERAAAAVVARTGGGVALVDDTGRILAWNPTEAGLAVLSAPGRRPGAPGQHLTVGYKPGLEVLSALPAVLRAQVTAVTVGPRGAVTLGLSHQVTAVLGSAVDLPAKFESLASLLAGAPPGGPEVIDLTVPEVPTVAPVAKAKSPTPTTTVPPSPPSG